MKAKEYFEKYFADLDAISAEEINNRLYSFLGDMNDETMAICEARKSRRNSCVDGALREQNDKWNAVGNLIEKKYHKPLLKRNGFSAFWEDQFKKMEKEKGLI